VQPPASPEADTEGVDQPLAATLPAPDSLLIVGPSALLEERVRQPDGQAVYDLLTGHPDRQPRDLVLLADLAVELRAWQDTDWRTQGIDVDGMSEAVVQLARRGQVRARWYHQLIAWDAKALGRPAMTYARAELRDRVSAWLAEQYMRWLHPTSGPRPDDEPFL
jgi:hypothetical protein